MDWCDILKDIFIVETKILPDRNLQHWRCKWPGIGKVYPVIIVASPDFCTYFYVPWYKDTIDYIYDPDEALCLMKAIHADFIRRICSYRGSTDSITPVKKWKSTSPAGPDTSKWQDVFRDYKTRRLMLLKQSDYSCVQVPILWLLPPIASEILTLGGTPVTG